MASPDKKHIIVIGAGIIGLQTAETLLRAGYAVTIVAEYWPGDEAPTYTSPWAGAHWRTHATAADKEQCEWDTETYRAWGEMVKRVDEKGERLESGLGVRTSVHYWENRDPEIAEGAASLWWSSVVSDFAVIPTFQLPPGVHFGVSFSTFAINVPRYLQDRLDSVKALGVKTVRARLTIEWNLGQMMTDAKVLAGGRAVHAYVNASGIGAKWLANDQAIDALRGQSVLVRGEADKIVTRLGRTKNDIRVIIPRPGSGTTIVGVSKEPGIWDTTANADTTKTILEGGKELAPELLTTSGEFNFLSVQVGLRPVRKGGPRVEAERLESGELILHEYGHSGAGYQNSIGSANKVLRLLQQHEVAKA